MNDVNFQRLKTFFDEVPKLMSESGQEGIEAVLKACCSTLQHFEERYWYFALMFDCCTTTEQFYIQMKFRNYLLKLLHEASKLSCQNPVHSLDKFSISPLIDMFLLCHSQHTYILHNAPNILRLTKKDFAQALRNLM